jgi:MoxR-like ATPase
MEKFKSDVESADAFKKILEELKKEIHKKIIAQEEVIQLVLTSIFCNGHSLLVGVPGLAKTMLVQSISSALDLNFNRIQFTPDLMPSDILGSETLDANKNFKFIKGPVFANIILADEINRTPPKTQSALLEAMQERKVTISGQDYDLQAPFFVLATQNPIEQEGTYPLPEAQLDRFMFQVNLDYPDFKSEVEIVKMTTTTVESEIKHVLNREEIIHFQELIRRVPVADNVVEYAVGLVGKTRRNTENAHEMANKYLDWGAGPRASQFLVLGAKCNALFQGKYSPDIEDVKKIAVPVLQHRIIRNFNAESEGISISDIINSLT